VKESVVHAITITHVDNVRGLTITEKEYLGPQGARSHLGSSARTRKPIDLTIIREVVWVQTVRSRIQTS
jgi:hypothetical protein